MLLKVVLNTITPVPLFNINTIYYDNIYEVTFNINNIYYDNIYEVTFNINTIYYDNIYEVTFNINTIYYDNIYEVTFTINTIYYDNSHCIFTSLWLFTMTILIVYLQVCDYFKVSCTFDITVRYLCIYVYIGEINLIIKNILHWININ